MPAGGPFVYNSTRGRWFIADRQSDVVHEHFRYRTRGYWELRRCSIEAVAAYCPAPVYPEGPPSMFGAPVLDGRVPHRLLGLPQKTTWAQVCADIRLLADRKGKVEHIMLLRVLTDPSVRDPLCSVYNHELVTLGC
ncbi:hypothetical protein SARC_06796, partial [Sphaeroforma arctica JP610]